MEALATLRVGAISDRWYLVTVGVTPGIYRCSYVYSILCGAPLTDVGHNSIQCAVLTVGVAGAVYNAYTDEMAARRAYGKAQDSGFIRAVVS